MKRLPAVSLSTLSTFCFLLPALLLSGDTFQTDFPPPPLSAEARAALYNPPENPAENTLRELESAWKFVAGPLLVKMLDDPRPRTAIDVRPGTFRSAPYVLFRAGGVSESTRRQVLIEIYRGAEDRIEQLYGRSFNPSNPGDTSIQSIDFYGDRAAQSTRTEDGSQAFYWQAGEIYIKVNTADHARLFADRVHLEALKVDLYAFPALLAPAPPPPNFDIPPLKANVTGLKFYEADMKGLPAAERKYGTQFNRSSTRAIWWQIDIEYPAPGRIVDFQLEQIWTKPDGSTLYKAPVNHQVQAAWTSSNHFNGWGWSDPGRWTPGSYRLEVFFEGDKITEGLFEIVDDSPPPVEIQDYDIPAIRAKVKAVYLYEGGRNGIPKADRVYRAAFPKSSTRYVYWELNLEHPKPGTRQNFNVDAVWYAPDGSLFAQQTMNTFVDAQWVNSYHQYGRGWEVPGNWTPGRYRIILSVNGLVVATPTFSVIDY